MQAHRPQRRDRSTRSWGRDPRSIIRHPPDTHDTHDTCHALHDTFSPCHLRRHPPRAPGSDHLGRPRRHLRRARGALVPAGAGPLRARPARGRPRGRAHAQRRPHARGGVRPPAFRPLLHAGQHAPERRGGGLHRRGLRCPHPHHLDRALNHLAQEMVALTPSIDLRLVVGEPAKPANPATPSPDPAGSTDYDEFVAPHPRHRARRRARRLLHAVLVGYHRPPQGRAPRPDRRPLRHLRHPHPDARAHHGLQRGRRLSQPRPAVPLRPARVVDDRAAHGRDRRRHGQVRPQPLPRADRTTPRHPRAVRADHVRPPAQAPRRPTHNARPRAHSARSCTPRPPARPK